MFGAELGTPPSPPNRGRVWYWPPPTRPGFGTPPNPIMVGSGISHTRRAQSLAQRPDPARQGLDTLPSAKPNCG